MGENFAQLAQASSLCGACKDACPVDIDLPRMLLRIRAGELPDESGKMKEGQGIPGILKLGLSGYSWVAAHPRLFAVSQKLAGWFSTPLPPFISVPAATGWGFSKDMPKPAARPFRESWGSTGKQVESRQVARVDTGFPVSLSTPTPISLSTLTERFTAELTTVGGQVYAVRADELPEKLTAFLRERGIDRVQMWDNVPALTEADPSIELRAGLAAAGIRVEPSAPDPSASSGQAPSPALRAGLAAGITGVLAGIAETGTLVIPGGAGRPLTASLLPGIHVAVLRAADILLSLEQAIRLPEVASAPATVLVTGPSRTGDIEMTLTIGVHGPKEVHVFIVNT
jgi:L-lactate utilization protein LutC